MVGWTFALTLSISPGILPGDYCNTAGEERVPWSTAAKAATRERASLVLDALAVSPLVASFHELVIWREAFGGEASVRHTLGVRENGLGTHGLSIWWHRDKWPGDDEDPAFCTPEVSTVVVHEIMWRAVTRFGARNLLEIQSVFAGAFECDTGACRFTLDPRRRRRLCERARSLGYDCRAPVSRADLGVRLTDSERRQWSLTVARAWLALTLGR